MENRPADQAMGAVKGTFCPTSGESVKESLRLQITGEAPSRKVRSRENTVTRSGPTWSRTSSSDVHDHLSRYSTIHISVIISIPS